MPLGPHDSDNPAQATTMSTLEINDASRSLMGMGYACQLQGNTYLHT